MRKEKQKYLILIITAAIFILDFTPIFQPAKNFSASFFNPLLGGFRQEKQKLTLPKEEQEFRQKLAFCQSQLLGQEQLEGENRRLRRLLQLPLPEDLGFIDAKVISQEEDFFIIDKGEEAGIKNEQLVLADNFLVGKVFKVEKKRSQVLRSDSSRFIVPVLIFANKGSCLGQDGIEDTCQKGKGVLKGGVIKEILREEVVESGDLISLLGGPNGILLGEVAEVKESQDKVFKEARVKRETPLTEIVYVFVIK
ncbi:rod shape-determining protein MreC [Candidatus Shapirobacteria bacterium]|nr:rod shape-determining protein MreC [Candidatus Shapirobacteria bacterium]